MAAKNRGKTIFGENSPDDYADTPRVKHFTEIAVFCTVSKINAFLCFTQTFKMAAKNGGKMIFGKTRQPTLWIP